MRVLEVIMSNYLYGSWTSKSELLSVMFCYSETDKEFPLGKTKISYNICYGILPYFRGIFTDNLKGVPIYSSFFDES